MGGEAVLVAALMEARWWIGHRWWCRWMVAKMALVMAWWMVQIEWMYGCVALAAAWRWIGAGGCW